MVFACSFDKGESATISAGGRDFAVTPELVELRKEQQKVSGRCAQQGHSTRLPQQPLPVLCARPATGTPLRSHSPV